jgi:hypothetical protein
VTLQETARSERHNIASHRACVGIARTGAILDLGTGTAFFRWLKNHMNRAVELTVLDK